ncbi:hypothetical protein IQ264_14250 [Phormidium sp. LEGE 05292]|uniref:hypothetical protein n=1 Tax=[Phormidium] sp. LEGE 05292 TaxID=767427 RepID=UPI0018819C35|nr:hypothetical protein [Phormidium sp. LEGE 05292]MBE9226586.1 hypothetical protein [Phormidium sp. LEGE 05292]
MRFVAVDLYIRTTKGNYRSGTELFSRVPYVYEKLKVKDDRFWVIEVCHYAKSSLNSNRDPVASVLVMRY